MTLYSRRDEAIHREIIEPLGDCSDQFDVEAIADEMITWHDEFNNKGEIDAPRSGFRIKEDIDFWALVERHALD